MTRLDEQHVEVRCERGAVRLSAAWRPGGTTIGAVVGAPHPQYGGCMDDPVVVSLAAALAGERIATLRFDWRRAGRSSAAGSDDLDDALADYRAAVDFLVARCAGRLIAAGYSYGAVAAVGTARRDDRVGALLLVAPPVALLSPDFLVGLEVPACILVGDSDHLAPLSVLGPLAAAESNVGLDVIEGAGHFFAATGMAALRMRARVAAASLGRVCGAA